MGVALVNQDGRFIKANPAFCQYLEYSEAELTTKRLTDITIPEDVPFHREMTSRVLTREIEGYDMPARYISKFQKVIRILSRATGLEIRGECSLFLIQISLFDDAPGAVVPAGKPSRASVFLKYHWTLITFILGAVCALLAALMS